MKDYPNKIEFQNNDDPISPVLFIPDTIEYPCQKTPKRYNTKDKWKE